MIQFGHSWSQIQDYTIPQMKLFLKCAVELEQEKRAVALGDMAIASQGNGKAIVSKIQELLSNS